MLDAVRVLRPDQPTFMSLATQNAEGGDIENIFLLDSASFSLPSLFFSIFLFSLQNEGNEWRDKQESIQLHV